MEILFCFRKKREEFQAMPGAVSMIERLDQAEAAWFYMEKPVRAEGNCVVSALRAGSVLVTDEIPLAEAAKAQGICCIGFQKPDDTSFFGGAEAVVTSLEDLSPEFFLQIHHHFYQLPLVIGETEHLIVRESTREDFKELYRITREEGNDRYTETMQADYHQEQEKFCSYISHVYSYYGFGLWTVLEKNTEKIVGRCGFSVTDDGKTAEPQIELGYLIGREFQGKGYAQEACRAALEYLYRIMEPEAVYAVIHRENQASLRVAEKLGFQILDQINEEYLRFRITERDT